MIATGLMLRMVARPDREVEAAELLAAVHRLSVAECQTEASFVLDFGDGAFATLDLFATEMARREHLAGAASQAIAYRWRDLFAPEPVAIHLDVVGHDLPEDTDELDACAAAFLGGSLVSYGTGWGADVAPARGDGAWGPGWVALTSDDGDTYLVDLARPEPIDGTIVLPRSAGRALAREPFALLGRATLAAVSLPEDVARVGDAASELLPQS